MLLGIVTVSIVRVEGLLSSGDDATAIATACLHVTRQGGRVGSVEINNENADIDGVTRATWKFTTTGPLRAGSPKSRPRHHRNEQGVEIEFSTPQSSIFATLLPLLLPVPRPADPGFFIWMQRRAQGQIRRDHVDRPLERPGTYSPGAGTATSPTWPATTG
ncbi:MAG: hypothetical protein H6518_13650 [Microthrixaceae bacterium]|nr:hypothetical protein [Microthrixaceae bacterium]